MTRQNIKMPRPGDAISRSPAYSDMGAGCVIDGHATATSGHASGYPFGEGPWL